METNKILAMDYYLLIDLMLIVNYKKIDQKDYWAKIDPKLCVQVQIAEPKIEKPRTHLGRWIEFPAIT